MEWSWKRRGGDNASNRTCNCNEPDFASDFRLRGLARSRRDKHPSRLDIPTPRCDRYDAAFTLRRCAIFVKRMADIDIAIGGSAMSSLPLKLIASDAGFGICVGVARRCRQEAQAQEAPRDLETAYGPQYRGTNCFPVRFISAVCISATILIRTSAFRSCAISAAGLAATPTDGPRCWLRRLCSRLIFAV